MSELVRCTSLRSSQVEEFDRKFEYETKYPVIGNIKGEIKEWDEGEWIRPLGHVETMFAIGGYLNSLNTTQAIWITSDKPLTRHLMVNALDNVIRRVPVLNMCIRRRATRLWFKRVSQKKIDFEIVHEDPMEVYKEVQSKSYNLSTGPLWVAKMVPLASHEKSPRGVKAENHYMIAFGVLHAITDATTNLIICKELIAILNNLIRSEKVPFMPYALSFPHAEKLIAPDKMFLSKYFCKKFYNVMILDFNKKTTFRGLIPLHKTFKEVRTKVLYHVFPEDVTQNLISQCKSSKASVHSCIVTAANFCYFDMVQTKSHGTADQITLYYADSVNLRRYYPKQEKEHIGCNISLHEQKTVITRDLREDFWRSARQSKLSLHEDLSSKSVLKVIPIMKYASIMFPFNIYHNKSRTRNITDSHYVTTNMGDITKLMEENNNEDPVKLTDIFRSVNGEQCGHFFALTFQTFRNRLYVSIDYSTNKMTDELANEFFSELLAKIETLAQTGNV